MVVCEKHLWSWRWPLKDVYTPLAFKGLSRLTSKDLYNTICMVQSISFIQVGLIRTHPICQKLYHTSICTSSFSVFRFSLRLHYHTNCSYRVHKNCSYRVFSLQEFKRNESRTSCSSSNYCTNFQEKKVKEKERKKKSLCKTLARKKKKIRFYETLFAEVRLEVAYNYKNYLRMASENFEEIFQLMKNHITKENTQMRELIPSRL